MWQAVGPASAAPAALPPAQTPALTARTVEPRDLESFLDGAIPSQLEAYHIPGATVSVVSNGQLLLAKGYGYADAERLKPVQADRTLFRVGSVSKLFVWTAVMQLVEQGKLDLNADVNSYLRDFKIPATFPQPVTMANLMTHTAGFEDSYSGIFVPRASDLQPIGPFLEKNLPARVMPPGQLSAYSNHGATLAAFIVEQITGMAFDQYVQQNILGPLGMDRSSFQQPLPAELAGDTATGYNYVGGHPQPQGFEYIEVAPAGALSSTATDMARFMIAHLENGRVGNVRILGEAATREMHAQHFTHDPRVSGMAYGFYEMNLNGQRLIVHGGDTAWFHTLLALIPDSRTGIFVSYNSPQGAQAREKLLEAFLNRYYPTDPARPASPPSNSRQDLARFTGTYWPDRISYTGYLKIAGLFNAVTVNVAPDGRLLMPDDLYEMKEWADIGPGLFKEVDGQQLTAFRTDQSGNATHLFMGNQPVIAFIKAPWYDTVPLQVGILGLCLLIFLSAALVWPISFLLHRWKGATSEPNRGIPHVAHWLAGIMAAIDLAFVIALVVLLSNPVQIAFGVPPGLPVALTAALFASVLGVAVVVLAPVAWIGRYWGRAARVHYSMVAIAAVTFTLWLNHWNLLGFHY